MLFYCNIKMPKSCPSGCISKKPCPSGKVPAVICRAKTRAKRNPWRKEEAARLRRAIEEIKSHVQKYQEVLSELLRLSLTPQEKPDISVIGDTYRHSVRSNAWTKGLMPAIIYEVVKEMTKKENIHRYKDPNQRYDHIVGTMKYHRDVKSIVTIKECVLQLCLWRWEGNR